MQAKSEILAAFMDESGAYVRRTWNQLYEKSRLSKGGFSRHFRDLLANKLIKGEVVIDPKTKRMLNIFEYTKLPLINVSATNDAIRIVSTIDGKGRKTPMLEKTEYGEMVKNPYAQKQERKRTIVEDGKIVQKEYSEEEVKPRYFRRYKKPQTNTS